MNVSCNNVIKLLLLLFLLFSFSVRGSHNKKNRKRSPHEKSTIICKMNNKFHLGYLKGMNEWRYLKALDKIQIKPFKCAHA